MTTLLAAAAVFVIERERERENSEKLQGSIFIPLFQFKCPSIMSS